MRVRRQFRQTVHAGLAAMTAYYLLWVAPRWAVTVSAPLAAAGTSAAGAVAGVAAFGAVYVAHTFAQVICSHSCCAAPDALLIRSFQRMLGCCDFSAHDACT